MKMKQILGRSCGAARAPAGATLVALAASAVLLAGCGQKGPLYLPGPAAAAAPAAAEPASNPATLAAPKR